MRLVKWCVRGALDAAPRVQQQELGEGLCCERADEWCAEHSFKGERGEGPREEWSLGELGEGPGVADLQR